MRWVAGCRCRSCSAVLARRREGLGRRRARRARLRPRASSHSAGGLLVERRRRLARRPGRASVASGSPLRAWRALLRGSDDVDAVGCGSATRPRARARGRRDRPSWPASPPCRPSLRRWQRVRCGLSAPASSVRVQSPRRSCCTSFLRVSRWCSTQRPGHRRSGHAYGEVPAGLQWSCTGDAHRRVFRLRRLARVERLARATCVATARRDRQQPRRSRRAYFRRASSARRPDWITWGQSSKRAACARSSRTCRPSTASTSSSAPANASRSSDRTARARRRRC